MKIITAILVSLFFVSGCSVISKLETSEATHILTGKSYPEIQAEEVKVFLKAPDFKYTEIGVIESRGMGLTDESHDMDLSLAALKREAAKIGANGVVITSSSQDIAGISKNGTSTERRIKAIAIRY